MFKQSFYNFLPSAMFVFAKLNLLCTVPRRFAVGVKTFRTGLLVLLGAVVGSFLVVAEADWVVGPGNAGGVAWEGVPGGAAGADTGAAGSLVEAEVPLFPLVEAMVLESNLVSTSSILVKPSLDSEDVMMMAGGTEGLGGCGGVAATLMLAGVWLVTAGNFFKLLLERNPLACNV